MCTDCCSKVPPSTAGRKYQFIPVTCWDQWHSCVSSRVWQWLSFAPSPPLHPQVKGNAPKTHMSSCQGHLNSSVTPSPFYFLLSRCAAEAAPAATAAQSFSFISLPVLRDPGAFKSTYINYRRRVPIPHKGTISNANGTNKVFDI